MSDYRSFLESKVKLDHACGFDVEDREMNPALKDHTRALARWALHGGRRALFAAFGMHKTCAQLEIMRLVGKNRPGIRLITLPLGVRQEFTRDARERFTGEYALRLKFIRRAEDIEDDRTIYLTNYESVREGILDIATIKPVAVSLDEASILRGFGGTKTFREVMAVLAGDDRRARFGVDLHAKPAPGTEVPFRFVATATPSPNEYIELLAYAAFLGIMDVGQAKTRFFKRNSEKADELTLHPHKEKEFWLWVASWALFVQRPSDLGFSDEGYDLPPLDVRWHEIPSDHTKAGAEKDGQGRLFRNAAIGVQDAAREKRDSLGGRVAKLLELRAEDTAAHRIIWHDLEAERAAIEAEVPGVVTVYGSQDLEDREEAIIAFSDGKIAELAGKPSMLGSGCNFQRHCAWSIFLGIGFKFNDFIQAIHRLQRFQQPHRVRIDLIYTEAEREVRRELERKWAQHVEQVEIMTKIIREFGLAQASLALALQRSIGVERAEAAGAGWQLVNNDCVDEAARMEPDSVGLIVTSIPFANQYEYTPSYNDFGHTDDNAHFWRQMDYLTPELFRILQPGRVCAIHVKDRITPGGINGFGFQSVTRISDACADHFERHGFAFIARKTVVTDVVRENNQTYRLGWTEQCKDGSRMGAGLPEYVLLFRKPPTDRSRGYADLPVVKDKATYTRARWQYDAHGFMRSSGNRLLASEDLTGLPQDAIFKLFRKYSMENVYDFSRDVALAEHVDRSGWLPSTFMLMPPQSWHQDVWTDITRMRTLNGLQAAKGREMHLCLARGSLVLARSGYKPIERVAVGDYVLTHKGRWRAVTVARKTGVQPVVTVQAHGVPGFSLTPDHKLWTRAVRNTAWAKAHAKLDASRSTPGWLPAADTVGSYVNLKLAPIEAASVDDLTYWWLVGRWLADGHIDAHGGAVISCGRHEVDDLKARLGPYGGNPAHGNGSAKQILLRDPGKKLRRTLAQCGRGAAEKQLPPEAFTLPAPQAGALLAGYLSGDGHYVASRGRWTASSVSKALLLGVAMLAQRVHGSVASIYQGRKGGPSTIQGRKVNTKPEWVLCFDLPNAGRPKGGPFVLDDGAWKKVRTAVAAGETETWCLRVDEDESFTAEGCVVKNCPLQFDIVDRLIEQFSMPSELVLDPFAGLGTVPYCAVKLGRRGVGIELNPWYFRDAIAYLKSAEAERAVPTLFDFEEELAA